MSIEVVIINAAGTGVAASEVVACAAALTIQAQQHFALPPPHGYGFGATVRAAAGPFDVKPNEWVLSLLAKADVEGALGYHDQTAHGKPLMKVFPYLDASDGVRWETTASHELLETLADPNIARCAQSWDGKVWAYGVCDACEQESYMIHGVPVSDFVLPPYFEPMKNINGLRLDWMGRIADPLEILPGGYGQWLDPSKGWTQVLSEKAPPRAYRNTVFGRGKVRMWNAGYSRAHEART
jgi:hypothetical protein